MSSIFPPKRGDFMAIFILELFELFLVVVSIAMFFQTMNPLWLVPGVLGIICFLDLVGIET